MSKHVGVRNRIVVAVSSLGLLIMLKVIALGLADIAGTSDRFRRSFKMPGGVASRGCCRRV
jgi:hypothetical protein